MWLRGSVLGAGLPLHKTKTRLQVCAGLQFDERLQAVKGRLAGHQTQTDTRRLRGRAPPSRRPAACEAAAHQGAGRTRQGRRCESKPWDPGARAPSFGDERCAPAPEKGRLAGHEHQTDTRRRRGRAPPSRRPALCEATAHQRAGRTKQGRRCESKPWGPARSVGGRANRADPAATAKNHDQDRRFM